MSTPPSFLSSTARLIKPAAAIVLLCSCALGQASVIGADTDVFQSDRFEIDFAGLSPGTTDPVYVPPEGASSGTVAFGSYFSGQSSGGTDSCGYAGCIDGTPNSQLSLDITADSTFVTVDGAAPNNPVLSGSPTFTGPISILFGQNQAGVGVLVGYAELLGVEQLTAFDRQGNELASVVNDAGGYSFLTLASDDASADIAGVQITRTGRGNTGFALSGLLFGGTDQVNAIGGDDDGAGGDTGGNDGGNNDGGDDNDNGGNPPVSVPAPGNMSLFALMLALIGAVRVSSQRRGLKNERL